MTKALYAVLLHGQHVGSLQQTGEHTTFVFDQDYWERPDRPVLGRWFEDHPRKRPHATRAVPPWFSNLLPEGRLRALVARELGVSTYQEMDLLARLGQDLPGAVAVVPEGRFEAGARLADSLPAERGLLPTSTGPRRASLAGMALKFSMSRQGDRLVVPAHGEHGDWIVKIPDQSYPDLPDNELSVMTLAQKIGIEVPEARLWHRDSIDSLGPGAWTCPQDYAYAVRRFDRSDEGPVHIEDFAQVLGRYGLGEGKYKSKVETVAGLAYRGYDHGSLREMVRRSVFNLLVGNGDAHLKNWSLIYPDKKKARLSPAYDLVCTAAYPNHAELGLTFFGAQRLEQVSGWHFAQLQEQLGAEKADVLDVVDQTLEAFMEVWPAHAPEGVPTGVAQWIDAHAHATSARLRAQR